MRWREVPPRSCDDGDAVAELEERVEALDAENAALKDQVTEVESWYRLLQIEHDDLRKRHGRCGLEAVAIRDELNRLEVESRELRDIVARCHDVATHHQDITHMKRFAELVKSAARHKLATFAVVAIGTLLVRDPAVSGFFSTASDRLAQAIKGRDQALDPDDGYLRYARMVNARQAAEAARSAYNEHEAGLKGDALLEAQDRLRNVLAADRQARLAFLPELARRCQAANVPVPGEIAVALTEIEAEARQ